MLDEQTLSALKQRLSTLKQPVKLIFFTQSKPACRNCQEQTALLKAVAATSDNIQLEIHDLIEDAKLARNLGIDKLPATVVQNHHGQDYGIRFFGITSGYEFDSLIEAIELVGTQKLDLPVEVAAFATLIDHPVHLEIMVTLTCPYCPKMVHFAHQLAYFSPHISADMVDSAEFPELVQRYQVHGVPRTIIDGRPAFEGALPPEQAILEILKHAQPDAWERIDEQIRNLSGERKAKPLEPDHLYDVIIVGAGPAAMTAAIYAARKALDVALIGHRAGGQILNTETIENWPGLPSVSGQDLATAFRRHAERFSLAERLGIKVTQISRDEAGFFYVQVEDARTYRARSVIYCAGKTHRTLGVPGEARFLGQGIAFCATCDAPLFTDKRVAVIGGGNSAFTAARDLLPWAREIHIINIQPDFQADPVLLEQVSQEQKIRLHPATHVRAFLGQKRLTGIRLESTNGKTHQDLAVDGVFLEIGLIPNTQAVEKLLDLDEQKQIPVARDGATTVPGFFAAGDVTDVPDKQIVIATGMGAQAALAATRYVQRTTPHGA